MTSIYGNYDTLLRVSIFVITLFIMLVGMREAYKNPEDKHKSKSH